MGAPGRTPPQVARVVAAAACERLSFHGMASVLALYANAHLLYAERDARVSYHAFLAATSLAPLAGAWIADRFLGRYRTILGALVAYAAGLAVLAGLESRAGLAVGLSLVAVGAGGAMPSLAAFAGAQLGADDAPLRRRLSRSLFWAGTAAAAASSLVVPVLLVTHGPRVALALPAACAILALLVFRSGRGAYGAAPPAGRRPHTFLRVVASAVSRLGTGHPGQHWLDLAREAHPSGAIEGAKAVLRMSGVFAAATLFWALCDQRGSSWVFQARGMDLVVAGHQLSPAELQALGPLLLLALVPLLGRVVFPLLARRGVLLTPLRKMTAGMFVTALSFAAAAVVQMLIDAGRAPHGLWQLPQYALLALGEVLVSVTGLELATSQAPAAMRSTLVSMWLLAMGVGNLLTAGITSAVRLEGAAWFWLFAALMLAAALAFRAIARAGRAGPVEAAVAE